VNNNNQVPIHIHIVWLTGHLCQLARKKWIVHILTKIN